MDFISRLEQLFIENADAPTALAMQAYMKNHFIFFGIKNQPRKALLKIALAEFSQQVKSDYRKICLALFEKPQREFHYCGLEILQQYLVKDFLSSDIALIEKLLLTHSWWDSVDAVAKHVLGLYLQVFPDEIITVCSRFSDSDNMWLNRSALLFQLGYKSRTDQNVLFALCNKHAHDKEFFIKKAIGWALREYAKTNPTAVVQFVNTHNLQSLSKREALKNI